MATCWERKTRILTYGRIMTRIFKAFGIDLTLEDVEEPSPYNTYNDMFMGHMKFERVVDGSWVRLIDFGAEDGHQHVNDDKNRESDMGDVKLNIPSLHKNNS